MLLEICENKIKPIVRFTHTRTHSSMSCETRDFIESESIARVNLREIYLQE